jgi:cobalt-precorrin 5A hydrolase / precorrin-3B C17-methyltransferase
MIAVVTLSGDSLRLGQRLHRQLESSQLYSLGTDFQKGQLNSFITNLWNHHRAFIFIMSTGIVVRSIAALIRDKASDPAILAVDEQGRHVIPLLSGHQGGANRLARQIAGILDADPVITTASDLKGYPGFDDLAGANGWHIEGRRHLNGISRAVLDGSPVHVYSDLPLNLPLPPHIRFHETISLETQHYRYPAVVITGQIIPGIPHPHNPCIVLRPRNITVGLGCRRGTPSNAIVEAIREAFGTLSLSIHSLAALATIPLKKDEPGLLEAAEILGVPIKWIETEEIKQSSHAISQASEFVKQTTGVAAVSEPAARIACREPVMLMTKKKVNGITLSIARDRSVEISMPQTSPAPHPWLKVVGIGPGGREHLSLKAEQVLQSSDIIIGYQTYIHQLERMMNIETKQVIPSAMTNEIHRCREAVARAGEGYRVALISGGDPGVYGMAGPLLEQLANEAEGIDVEIIPGITAATAAAARLGAPLIHDFSVISLSDRLTRRELIRQRLEAAAAADMVIVLYNPRSKGRPHQLKDALHIIATHRSPDTPVGIVSNAGRPGESVIQTTLKTVPVEDVTMASTVIIGNSRTQRLQKWIITPRGYRQ